MLPPFFTDLLRQHALQNNCMPLFLERICSIQETYTRLLLSGVQIWMQSSFLVRKFMLHIYIYIHTHTHTQAFGRLF
ncbi:hypothetical protein VIGAN_04002800 [Vigna angularis var. angularis]|uniref:Uncharacterized protein n=1 Tax=Vigna angularis var. angularis TaxID=157739 RepID=A0A0S3RQV2_PHAAN|nr:hypothetical protein VIGAN_04002800 [Vigna angularis var. angularis]